MQLAIFATVRAQTANNNQSTGELQLQAQCFECFVRRIRDLAINIMDPLPGQMAAQPDMYEIERRMDSVKAQMESHLSEGTDAMSHFYLPPSMLDVGAMLTAILPFNITSMVNLISDNLLRSVEREARTAVVMGKPSGDRTRHLFEFTTECFEKWSVNVVGVKLNVKNLDDATPVSHAAAQLWQHTCDSSTGVAITELRHVRQVWHHRGF